MEITLILADGREYTADIAPEKMAEAVKQAEEIGAKLNFGVIAWGTSRKNNERKL